MEVLVYLAARPGRVVSRDTLIRDLWGDTFVTDAALTRCIAELRKVFDDDVRDPRVIQTIAKSGYRLIAPVEAARDGTEGTPVSRPVDGEKAPGRSLTRRLPPVLLVTAGLIIGAAAMFVALRPAPPKAQPVLRSALPLGAASLWEEVGPSIAMSPDGSRVAYVGVQGTSRRVFVRALDSTAVTSIPESEGARDPFFSPDSHWVAFWADGKLKKVLLTNLSVTPICDTAMTLGASWGAHGTIVFSSDRKLYRVPDSGGQPQLVAAPDPEKRELVYLGPEILPAGDVVLFQVNRLPGLGEVVALPLSGGRQRRVLPDAYFPRYVPTGHLLYGDRGRLMAVPFDAARLEVTGPPVAMSDEVYGQNFDVGAGTLVYSSGNPGGLQLVWVDRTGSARQIGPVKDYHHPALSPDGRRIAVTVERNIWIYDIARESLTQVTTRGGWWPIWTPDGKRLTYVAMRDGALNVVWKSADGAGDEEQLTTSSNNQSAASWSPDGQLLAFQEFQPSNKSEIWLLDIGHGRKLRCFLCTDASEGAPVFSPDGQWLAYTTSGEVYVRRVDGAGERYQVSNGMAYQPLWSRDGKQLFYWKGHAPGASVASMQMMAADVTLGPVFRAGKPRALFEGRYRWGGRADYDVTADGQYFLMIQPVQSAPITQLELVVNWFEELRARVRPGPK